MLWCEPNRREYNGNPITNDPDLFSERTFLINDELDGFCRAHQKTSFEDDGHPPWFGMLAFPIEENQIPELENYHDDIYRLGLRTGRLERYSDLDTIEPFNQSYIHVHLPNKRNNNGNEQRRTWKDWEKVGRYTHHLSCQYCSRDFTHKRSNQYSNLQTRGNEFFLGTISTMNSELDPVQSSMDYPHQGRKTLIFSDSRQGAARLATKFKTDSSIDEGRSFFAALHNQTWFQNLPEEERVVGKIYPYLCIFAGQKRMNPLNDSQDLGRTTMLVHTASLATYFAITCRDQLDIGDLVESKMADVEFEVERDKFVRKLIKRQLEYQRNKVIGEFFYNSNLDIEVRNQRIEQYRNSFRRTCVKSYRCNKKSRLFPSTTIAGT